jgi:integrase
MDLGMKPEETLGNAESAKKMQRIRPSKLSFAYWMDRVFKPSGKDGGIYWVQIQHAGRRHAVGLNSADRRTAANKAANFYGDVRGKGWDAALAILEPDKHGTKVGSTVGDVVATLGRVDLRERTRRNYVTSIRWWAAQHLGMKPGRKEFSRRSEEYSAAVDAVALATFSPKIVEAIRDRFIAARKGDAMGERSARISMKSWLRNAKAAIGAAEKLGRLQIPEPRPFHGVVVAGAVTVGYRSRFDPVELIRTARETLASEDPDAFMAILLALGAGLRRSEIENLRWRSVDRQRLQIAVQMSGGWQAKNAQSEAAVDVDEGLIMELEKHRAGPEDQVVTPGSAEAAVRWLRKQGIKDNKPMHTLRKEFGSIVCQSADLLTASKQLRHSSLAVTAGIYVESRRKAAPAIGAMLGSVLRPEAVAAV